MITASFLVLIERKIEMSSEDWELRGESLPHIVIAD